MISVLVISEPGSAGVKRHVLDLLFNLDKSIFDLTYVYSLSRRDDEYQDEISRLDSIGVDCKEAPMKRGFDPFSDLRSCRIISQVIKQKQPLIIHCHSSKAGFLVRCMKALRLIEKKTKIVFTPNVISFYNSRIFYPVERFLARYTDVMIASSESEKSELANSKVIPEDRIERIFLGVKRQYKGVSKEPNPRFVVASCGRVCKQKNPLMFFRVANILRKQDPSIEFKWIGSYPDEKDREAEKALEYFQNHDLKDTLKITGWIKDVDTEIANSDLLCMFSSYESFGYVTVDAMMMKVPVIGIEAMGTVDHIIDNETGWICRQDPNEIANKIAEIKENRDKVDQVVENAHLMAKTKYDLSTIIQEHEDLYSSLASG